MADMATSRFGSLLRRHRQAAGLTQAERAGISWRGLNDLERGVRRHPRKDTVVLLAAALGLPAEDRTIFETAARGIAEGPSVAPDAHSALSALPMGTVTFFFTDIEGSTHLLQELGASRYAMLQAEYRQLLRAAMTAHGGHEVDSQGDSSFMVFAIASSAVAAAVAAQRAMAAHPWPAGTMMRTRMGIHSGTAQVAGERYIGLDVHRTALAWAMERGKSEPALRLAGALYYFWELRAYWSEGQKWLDQALALFARQQSGQATAGEVGETSIPVPGEAALRAKVLYAAGRLRFAALIDFAGSRTIVEESLRLWRTLGDKWWMATALEHVGFMLLPEDAQTAIARLEEGVALAREVEDRWPLAMCLVRLAGALAGTDAAAARRLREEGVKVARSVGDKSVLSQGLEGLAPLYWQEGNLTAAASVAEEALVEASAIGSVTQIFLSIGMLMFTSCLQGDLATARGYCLQALAYSRETGASQWAFLGTLGLGVVACFDGQSERGVRLLAAVETYLLQRGLDLSNLPGAKGTGSGNQCLKEEA
jgi:class 3 adenylate cyclase